MALFGAPIAHEDDAERAVRAALAIQEAVADLRAGRRRRARAGRGDDRRGAGRAGGGSRRRGEGMASGDVVNTAARLQVGCAGRTASWWTRRTHRATDRAIRYAEAEPITAKGKAEPVPVWAGARDALAVARAGAGRRPAAGRAAGTRRRMLDGGARAVRESEPVDAAGDHGRRAGDRQDPAGAGAAPARRRAARADPLAARPVAGLRRGRRVLGAGRDGEGPGRHPGVRLARSRRREKLDEAVAAIVVGRARSRRGWRGICARWSVWSAAAGVSAEGGRVEAFAAWRRFFEALAEDGPTVLVFEDMHWADDALLDFIDLLADRAGAVPLLIVCTARPEFLERRPGWGGGKTNAQTIKLAPLSAEDTAASDRRAARSGAAARRHAAGAAGARGGKPAVRPGVRAHAARPGRARPEGRWLGS